MIEIWLVPLDTYRDALQCIYDERTREHARVDIQTALQREYDEAEKKFGKKTRRTPYDATVWETIDASFRARAKAHGDTWDIERKEYRERLQQLAKSATVPRGSRSLIQVIWKTSYSNQTQAEKYAYESARQYVDICELNDIPAEVVQDEHGNYNVYAECSADDWTILKHKPGLSLKEWLRRCWKRGVNPRVYNPYLPHGLEDRLGLDYQGNEK